MPFLLLLFLTLACLPDDWPAPAAWVGTPARSTLLTWLAMGLGVATAVAISREVQRRVARDPGRREAVLRRYGSWRLYHLLGLFAVYGGALYLFGWGWAVNRLCCPEPSAAGPLVLASELLTLAPFLAALVLSWACFYDAESALHAPVAVEGEAFWGRWAYVGFHVRHNLALVLIPLLLLVLEKGLRKLFPGAEQSWQVGLTFVGGALGVAVLVCMPWILRLVLGLRPLPDCPLRARLLATARRLNFRCSDILVWNTRGGVANAMVAGVLPAPRYVLLTDRLITDLTPEEVEAVFGHEIGHVKHRHMPYYLGFLLLSLFVVWSGVALFLPASTREDLAVVPLIGVLGAYIFVVFGFLSRRCERQADIYGCRAVSCLRKDCLGHDDHVVLAPDGQGLCPTGIRIFIAALEKVAFLNGISRDRPGWLQSWQHSTIARRVDFLQQVLRDPTLEPRFQRTVGLVKWGLVIGLGACLAVLVYVHSQP
ncbi:MAG TPA: M48 family metallopeptidase [Gemmataceae bacterium]|nr:M48 family metallopeptidase [Gemmataceae bacterium]